jgi:hypothetical protein
MNSLLLLNGSPRGPAGNTPILLERIGEGWDADPAGAGRDAHGAAPDASGSGSGTTMLHLARRSDFETAIARFAEAETVVLGMPLYTDAMPGRVKEFIEALEGYVGRDGNPRLGFMIQSGFSEALHSRHLERYLAKLARRLGCEYAGTIVKGGGEGIRVRPERWNRKLFERMRSLGASLARDGRFDESLLAQVAGTERLSATQTILLSVANTVSIGQLYWIGQLKRNGAYERRFARPYA